MSKTYYLGASQIHRHLQACQRAVDFIKTIQPLDPRYVEAASVYTDLYGPIAMLELMLEDLDMLKVKLVPAPATESEPGTVA